MSRSSRLIDKYRPQTLSEIVGQGRAVQFFQDFVAAPHSAAFLICGPTGVGKSSLGLALANELGCHPVASVWHLEAGQQTEEDLQPIFDDLRYAPMGGGWRVVIIEEADWMARCPKAAMRWLSILDALPTRTVFVFTTNEPDKFPQRFLDRTERIDFVGTDGTTYLQDAQLLVDRIWTAETGRTDSPRIDKLPGVLDMFGVISYRRTVQALQSIVRATEPFELSPPVQPAKTLWQAAVERRTADTPAEVKRLIATLPVPVPPPVKFLSPRREDGQILKPQNDREREERVLAYLDVCTSKPTPNAVSEACAVSWTYAKKMIACKYTDQPLYVERLETAEQTIDWSDLVAMQMAGGY